MQQLRSDPASHTSSIFQRKLRNVRRFGSFLNPDAVNQMREVLKRYRLHKFEECVAGNVFGDR
uniref:Uncharacterized protein n=1 Tax=Physcomitrium patens TaxID=3218 RepID=A0A2K1JD84_PHYPA|nr:hypothetical protein PHYPA_019769 [Physcomitrium patens]